MRNKILYLLTITILGCNYSGDESKTQPQQAVEYEPIRKQSTINVRPPFHNIIGVEQGKYNPFNVKNNLRTLVIHCHEFIENSRWYNESGRSCEIIIPETRKTDNLISGKYSDDGYHPKSIPLGEGFMTISHHPRKTPELIINGSKITGRSSECYLDDCLDPIVERIYLFDSHNKNNVLKNRINYYAQEVLKRYDHGVKRF